MRSETLRLREVGLGGTGKGAAYGDAQHQHQHEDSPKGLLGLGHDPLQAVTDLRLAPCHGSRGTEEIAGAVHLCQGVQEGLAVGDPLFLAQGDNGPMITGGLTVLLRQMGGDPYQGIEPENAQTQVEEILKG